MRRKSITAFAALVCLLVPQTALAWNSTGHRVVARIAWSHMTTRTRDRVTALLRKAPADADLSNNFSTNPDVDEQIRQRRFLLYASTWPDVVRDKNYPQRRQKYHKREWHFADYFWAQPDPNKPPKDIKGPPTPNATERLRFFYDYITKKPAQFDANKALGLAWMLHLIGDIHQPLHCSAHVTKSEPDGDQGGNLFCLDHHEECYNLHSYWDSIFDNVYPRKADEDYDRYVTRIAGAVMQRHPNDAQMKARIKSLDFAAWTLEGYAKAKSAAYPKELERFEAPSEDYRDAVQRVAEESAALAGYRLADTLNRMFDN